MNIYIMPILLLFVQRTKAQGYCTFPEFIWTTPSNSPPWISKTEHLGASALWDRQSEIVVHPKEIIIHEKKRSSCDPSNERRRRHGGYEPCHRQENIIYMYCLMQERNQKYRVLLQDRSGRKMFSCIHFNKINDNIIQIDQANPIEENEDKLCHDKSMHRADWIWISPSLTKWTFCPSLGGFDFRTTSTNGGTICGNEWLPSRIEAECLAGENMVFRFPRPICNPFDVLKTEFTLHCWGQWLEEDYMFLLLGEYEKEPRYILKFPKNIRYLDELETSLFLNAIAPLNDTAYVVEQPQMRLTLRLLRSAPGTCADESELCVRLAEEGRCMASSYNRHVTMCKKTCGLCSIGPNMNQECSFPEELQGDWLMFTSEGRNEMSVLGGDIMMSTQAHYVCKSRWEQEYFKIISSYTNGCRPRYNCIKLWKGEDGLLRYQISRSSLEDISFDLCTFQDDVAPLGGTIHSATPKLLLPIKSMFVTDCHLAGSAVVDITFADDRTCSGYLSDRDPLTCQPRSSLLLDLPEQCRRNNVQHFKFTCIASVPLSSNSQFLVTQDSDQKHICWKVSFRVHDALLTADSYERTHCDNYLLYGTEFNQPHHIKTITTTYGVEQGCGRVQGDAVYQIVPLGQSEDENTGDTNEPTHRTLVQTVKSPGVPKDTFINYVTHRNEAILADSLPVLGSAAIHESHMLLHCIYLLILNYLI